MRYTRAMKGTLDIRNFTRSHKTPRVPFQAAAKHILPGWDISLVFVGETRAKHLNVSLRNKDYVPNVLSYTVGEKSGEIIICPAVATKQAPEYDLLPSTFYLLLFIHGLLHLKGKVHGATMEKAERELLSRFVTVTPRNEKAHRNRH